MCGLDRRQNSAFNENKQSSSVLKDSRTKDGPSGPADTSCFAGWIFQSQCEMSSFSYSSVSLFSMVPIAQYKQTFPSK